MSNQEECTGKHGEQPTPQPQTAPAAVPATPLYDPAVKSKGDTDKALKCFDMVVNEMHTCVVATVDDAGRPVTCVIDMMGYDERGLYFVTNAGKGFYHRLVERGCLSLSATNGKPTMECVAVTVQGEVQEAPASKLDELLEANPYMYELYPTPERRATLRPFCICHGTGNVYDLSVKPPTQVYFEF